MANAERKRRRFWLKLAAGLLFALVAYSGTYLGTVERQSVLCDESARYWNTAMIYFRDEPIYPLGEQLGGNPYMLRPMFAPAHWVDRQFRPRIWARYSLHDIMERRARQEEFAPWKLENMIDRGVARGSGPR